MARRHPAIYDRIDAAIRYYAWEGQAFVVCATPVMTTEIIEAIGAGGEFYDTKSAIGSSHRRRLPPDLVLPPEKAIVNRAPFHPIINLEVPDHPRVRTVTG